MIGKQVRVFWPIDSSWYTGTVQRYDPDTAEHLLKYDDDDTEWVKIGENGSSGAGGAIRNASPTESAEQIPPRLTRNRGEPSDHGINHSVASAELAKRMPPFSNEFLPGASLDQKWGHPQHPALRSGITIPPQTYFPYPGGPGGQPTSQGMYPGGPPGYSTVPPYPPHAYPGQPSPYPGGHLPYGFPPLMGMPGGPPGLDGRGPIDPNASPNSVNGLKRKQGPKAWTTEEDSILLVLVQNMRMPMKWSIVAHNMSERTGKQCRERYVNHLNPRLKVCNWSPVEDSTIFHLYNTMGSHWAKMSKMIPGRTDNGIKNRFHNLRRQLEREDEHRLRLSKASDFPNELRLDRLRDFPTKMKGKSDDLWNMQKGIGILAAQSVLGGGIARNAGRFGPFRVPKDEEPCIRCGLFVPSIQCGSEICCETGWCQSCTRIPPHVSGSLLRECLNLRRCQDTKQRDIVENKWTEWFQSDKDPQKEELLAEDGE